MGTKMDELIQNINKVAKEIIVTKGISDFNYERIPFTSPRMNYCTYGGLPVGKITEFFGLEHGGKTTTALDIVANYQNMVPDREVLFVDSENSLDVEWAMKIGVDVNNLIILQPKEQSAEEIFQFILDSISTGEVGLWVLDSIGALVSEQELNKKLDERTYAGISQPLTRFSKEATMLMRRYNCTGIGINQVRQDLNNPWGGYKTPGGEAWKHHCLVRMEFRKGKFLDEKGNELANNAKNPAGNIIQMVMHKNKTCPANRRVGQYTINYTEGIDYLKDLVDVALFYEIVGRHGAWYNIVDKDTGEILVDKIQGQANLYEALSNDVELLQRVEELVDKNMDCSMEEQEDLD